MASSKARSSALCLLLAATTFALYFSVTQFDFVNYDDPKYVTENPQVRSGLTWAGVAWAFTTLHASNWHPLTWLSHMLDVQVSSLNPSGHHLTNLVLHIANSCLLFLLLRRMTRADWSSAFVAALFAWHPLHVESVAWISERKDVLSGLFFMLTLWAYSKYTEPAADRSSALASRPPPRGSRWYLLSLFFFACGLMSKPMLVTLPFVLLLLDWWPLSRLQPATFWRRLREKLPFMTLALASCAVTFWAQRSGGAVAPLDAIPLAYRILNAMAAYQGYLEKMLWPAKLAVLYLHPHEPPLWQGLVAAIVLVALSLGALRLRRSQPYLLFGWLWYLGMLVPVIGIVQVGEQSMADRYTYLPLIGPFIALAWSAEKLTRRWHHRERLLGFGALGALALLLALTTHQLKPWNDGETLFAHCVQVTTGNYIAHNNLGNALLKKGKFKAAQDHFREALHLNPYYTDGMRNLGVVLTQQGQTDEALELLREGTRRSSDAPEVYSKLALALSLGGNPKGAIAYYRESLRLRPDQVEPCNNLAWILATHPDPELRDGAEAVRLAERACGLTRYQTTVPLGTLAAAYAESGRFEAAAAAAEKAIALAQAAGQTELAQKNRGLLDLYRAGKPYHETAH